jgi:hypothetical protein
LKWLKEQQIPTGDTSDTRVDTGLRPKRCCTARRGGTVGGENIQATFRSAQTATMKRSAKRRRHIVGCIGPTKSEQGKKDSDYHSILLLCQSRETKEVLVHYAESATATSLLPGIEFIFINVITNKRLGIATSPAAATAAKTASEFTCCCCLSQVQVFLER